RGVMSAPCTAGSGEASAMPNSRAGVGGGEPRSSAATQSQPKRPPAEVAKQQPTARPAAEQPKTAEQPKAAAAPSPAQAQPKTRPSASAQARALPDARALPEERHAVPTPASSPPVPVLQPFEE